jgi:hypothetical protein
LALVNSGWLAGFKPSQTLVAAPRAALTQNPALHLSGSVVVRLTRLPLSCDDFNHSKQANDSLLFKPSWFRQPRPKIARVSVTKARDTVFHIDIR